MSAQGMPACAGMTKFRGFSPDIAPGLRHTSGRGITLSFAVLALDAKPLGEELDRLAPRSWLLRFKPGQVKSEVQSSVRSSGLHWRRDDGVVLADWTMI